MSDGFHDGTVLAFVWVSVAGVAFVFGTKNLIESYKDYKAVLRYRLNGPRKILARTGVIADGVRVGASAVFLGLGIFDLTIHVDGLPDVWGYYAAELAVILASFAVGVNTVMAYTARRRLREYLLDQAHDVPLESQEGEEDG